MQGRPVADVRGALRGEQQRGGRGLHDGERGSGSGGDGGGGAAPVDVSGDVVQFTTTVFDTTIGYPEEATVLAPGVDTQTVVAEAVGGA
ncbi:MAG: hypothetical protein R3B70_14060 [Polyangiaceae bacterium]